MSSLTTSPLVDNAVETLEAGLDSLTTSASSAPKNKKTFRRILAAIAPPLLTIVFLLLLWAGLSYFKAKPSSLLPSPASVFHSATKLVHQGVIWHAVGNSLRRAALGFLASVVVGALLGVALVQFRFLRMGIGPLVSGLQSLPSVAWVPAAIIWFGVGDAAIYTVVLFGAVPSIANGLLAGARQVPPLYLRVGRVIGARGLNTLRYIILPGALPGFFAGLRQGWAFSWRALMAAELITASPGLGTSLGQLLQNGRRLSDMNLVLTAIILILIVGVGIEFIVFGPIERRILRTRGLLADS